MASSIFSNQSLWKLSIPETHCHMGKVFYHIHVKVGNVTWTVNRRYSEFAELNLSLTKDQGLNKDLLPPKKYVGNLDPQFIDQRRILLELYINRIFQLLVKTMPPALANFLELGDHDIMFIVKKIPPKLAGGEAKLSVLEIHSLSARLKLPCPPVEMTGYQHDISGVLEACCKTTSLHVDGSNGPYSNIDNPPTMDFLPFKSLQSLVLMSVPPDLIVNADSLRNTLHRLSWVNSSLGSIEDALLCDSVHKNLFKYRMWAVSEVDFSNNCINSIDSAVTLIPDVSSLDISSNSIKSLEGLNHLTKLQKLNVTNNKISCFLDLKLDQRLASLTWISLANNHISSLEGFNYFKSLQFIDVSSNAITDFSEISHLCPLPHLSDLILSGNPISSNCDYRAKVLEQFNERASFVSIDGALPSRKELDKVAVLQALRMVKEGRSPL